jgi:hypothetical protein
MIIKHSSQIRSVKGILNEEIERIKNFLQGAIYCWCKNKKEKWFSLRDLMGRDNFYWQGTPLLALYEKHLKKGKSSKKAITDAGKDCGWILKKVIHNDKRKFETKKADLIRNYKWVNEK